MSFSVSVSKSLRLLQEIRRIVPEMHAHEAEVLLVIARHPGITQQEVIIHTRLSSSTVSRHVRSLREQERGLVCARESLKDARYNELHLTPTGEAFVRELTGFL